MGWRIHVNISHSQTYYMIRFIMPQYVTAMIYALYVRNNSMILSELYPLTKITMLIIISYFHVFMSISNEPKYIKSWVKGKVLTRLDCGNLVSRKRMFMIFLHSKHKKYNLLRIVDRFKYQYFKIMYPHFLYLDPLVIIFICIMNRTTYISQAQYLLLHFSRLVTASSNCFAIGV